MEQVPSDALLVPIEINSYKIVKFYRCDNECNGFLVYMEFWSRPQISQEILYFQNEIIFSEMTAFFVSATLNIGDKTAMKNTPNNTTTFSWPTPASVQGKFWKNLYLQKLLNRRKNSFRLELLSYIAKISRLVVESPFGR